MIRSMIALVMRIPESDARTISDFIYIAPLFNSTED